MQLFCIIKRSNERIIMKFIDRSSLNRIAVIVLSSFLLILYVVLIDPSSGGLLVILGPIILAWVILYAFVSVVLDKVLHKTRITVVRFVSATIASSGLFFLLLSGIGTISAVDVVLTSALVLIIGFYVARLWK